MYDADSETSLFDRPGVSSYNKFDALARLDNPLIGGEPGQLRRGSAPNDLKVTGEEITKVKVNGEDERTQAVFQKVGHKAPKGAKVQELSKKLAGMSLEDSNSEQSTASSSSRSGKPQEGEHGKRYITTAKCDDNGGESDNNTDDDTNKTMNDSDEETNARLGGEGGSEGKEELLNHMDAKDGDSDGESNTNLHRKQVKTNFIKGKLSQFNNSSQEAKTSSPPAPAVDKEANKLSVATGGAAPVVNHNSTTSPPPSPRTKATTALTGRYAAKHMECSVQSCLSQFTAPEWLTGANRFGCETCAKRQRTTTGEYAR